MGLCKEIGHRLEIAMIIRMSSILAQARAIDPGARQERARIDRQCEIAIEIEIETTATDQALTTGLVIAGTIEEMTEDETI